jgi:lambda repressor-like predicted transcriptional regulator
MLNRDQRNRHSFLIASFPRSPRGARLVSSTGEIMSTLTRQEQSSKNGSTSRTSPAEVLLAYLEKSPIVQAVIRDLLNILKEGKTTPQERDWAEAALQDALFRHQTRQRGQAGRVVSAEERLQMPGLREAHQRMEEEETEFAANLARLLKEKEISQAELAKRVGVGRSAISMMLSRQCRPQKRTVEKIAHALGVELRDLWPG